MKHMVSKKVKPVGGSEDVQNLKNQLARALADYDNLRKRVEKEREDLSKLAGLALFTKLMPIFDALARAQNHLKDEGLSQVMLGLKKVLDDAEIVNVSASVGGEFDANLHEAVDVEETKESGKRGRISEVITEGWMVKEGPVIRPAKVRVYGEKVEKKEKLEEEMARGNYT